MNIGWICIGNEQIGSTRIFSLAIHKQLLKLNVSSHILNLNDRYYPDPLREISLIKKDLIDKKITHLILQKVCFDKTKELVYFCKENNIKTIYASGDWHENEIYSLVNGVILGSPLYVSEIKNKYQLEKVFYIEDALEYITPKLKEHVHKENITLGWFGNYSKINHVLQFYKELNISLPLVTISNTPSNFNTPASYIMGAGTSHPWDTQQVIEILLSKVDILFLPINLNNNLEANAKSANRLTLAMSLGIPVVTTPISSYVPLISNKINGFLCENNKNWLEAISILSDYKKRSTIGQYSALDIQRKFNISTITTDFLRILEKI